MAGRGKKTNPSKEADLAKKEARQRKRGGASAPSGLPKR